MATQTEEASMGLRKYSKAELRARPASPQRSRSRTPRRSPMSTAASSTASLDSPWRRAKAKAKTKAPTAPWEKKKPWEGK
eukprot:7595405-Karenia_brevis.AAC.1